MPDQPGPATSIRIVSGIQPSGPLHLGNYFGMIRPAVAFQTQGQAFYFVADGRSLKREFVFLVPRARVRARRIRPCQLH